MPNTAVKKRVQDQAELQLQNKLAYGAQMVPCPKCRWVNDGLISGYRQSQFMFYWPKCVMQICVAQVLMVMTVLGIVIAMDANLKASTMAIIMGSAAVGTVALTVWAYKQYLKWRRGRINPNLYWPAGEPVVPHSTPPALDIDTAPTQANPGRVYLNGNSFAAAM